MANFSFFTIAWLSSTLAFELPSPKETFGNVQKTLSPLKSEFFAAGKEETQKLSARLFSPHAQPRLPGLLQEDECEMAEYELPCIAALDLIGYAMYADNTTEAMAVLDELCMNCTDPAGDLEAYATACNITDEDDLYEMDLVEAVLTGICEDTECAANILWYYGYDFEGFCDNLECGADVIEPYIELFSEESSACVSAQLQMFCLTDEDPDAEFEFCTDALDYAFEDTILADFCESSCAEDLSLIFDTMVSEECIDPLFYCEDDEETSDFRLLDYCTQNDDEDYCLEVLEEDETNMTACDDIFALVPAPGADDIVAPSECPAGCSDALQSFVDNAGCCADFALDFSCASDVLVTFIQETCGISYDECERPEYTVVESEDDDDAVTMTAGITFISVLIGTLVLSMLM